MAAKRGIRREFHSYARTLARTKRDVRKIVQVATSQMSTEDRLDDIVPCLKRILERIVYGCLEIQIPVYGKRVSARRWQNKKASELVKMVDPKFYPSPNPDRGGPYIKIAPTVQDSDALTQEQWLTAWNFVNQIQHVQNPASNRRKPDPQMALDDALKWTQRAVNLLSHHSVMTTDTAFFGHVTMHPPHPNQDVQVEVMERVTSWSESHNFPSGASLKLQIQDKGEWRDVEDPQEGALSLACRHGIYTPHGFQRTGNLS
ncbi:MAG: hypothetical protein OYG32_11000 [Rhodospirillaceae bacterium]|nr:hypothetical protein [Rhodospirillaceae bacterium]MDE0255313.1 hypothetical protein [Rhodospirillaceae bacterium]MDE0616206.1 hypothetical protein [Rhodospirillaceae bacterium]